MDLSAKNRFKVILDLNPSKIMRIPSAAAAFAYYIAPETLTALFASVV